MENWKETTEESKKRWEQIAASWDSRMGDSGNRHSLELVFPATEQFLCLKPGDRVLDAACGNGTFSRRLAAQGAVRINGKKLETSSVPNLKNGDVLQSGKLKFARLLLDE
jgi:2-polyprenyl-3-methyl-5-hydroxy-6-metoxy-1,4-benzoquinol methylase